MKASKKINHFTLVELLIVIAMLGILLSMLLPSLHSAKLSAMTGVSMSNLKQIYTGTVSYASDHNGFLPLAANNPAPSSPDANWRPVIYTYITGEAIPESPECNDYMDGSTYRGVMYCPVIVQDRGAYPKAHRQGRGSYGMNHFFGKKVNHASNDRTQKGYKSMQYASLTADKEPLYMATKEMINNTASGYILNSGSLFSDDSNSPDYIYPRSQALACFLNGAVTLKSASWGSSVDGLISEWQNFE